MVDYEQTAFEIISTAGSARSHALEAIAAAKIANYENAFAAIQQGEQELITAGQAHLKLVSQEAQGSKVMISMLLLHAEDLMISAQMMLDMSKTFVDLYQLVRLKDPSEDAVEKLNE